MTEPSLQNLHTLITGGGTGIGLATATELARHGANVTICGRNLNRLESVSQDKRFFAVQMDVTIEDSVRQAIDKAVERYGNIAIHVANAGIAEGKPFMAIEHDDWRRIMATNLDGAFLTIQAALESMHRGTWGRIIAISSVAGLRGLKGATAYTASKHGLIGLIRGISEEFLHSGITANAICPGYVDTPLVSRNIKSIAKELNIAPKDARAKLLRLNRHHRMIRPEEVANCVSWLCRPGSESINGQTIPVTGGHV